MATELALYQTGLPVAQDTDNKAVVLLQILGFDVPVGAVGAAEASPVIVQLFTFIKFALSAADAQYFKFVAPMLLPVTVPALKPVRVAS